MARYRLNRRILTQHATHWRVAGQPRFAWSAQPAAAVRPISSSFCRTRASSRIPRLAWWPILNLIILNTRPPTCREVRFPSD